MQFIDEFRYCGIILFDKSFHPEIIQVLMNGATMSKIVDKLVNILLGKANFVSEVLQLLIVLHTCTGRYSSMANSKKSGIVDACYTDCTMMLNTRGELDASDSCLTSTETCGMVWPPYSMIHSYCLSCVHSPTSQHSCSMRLVELSADRKSVV